MTQFFGEDPTPDLIDGTMGALLAPSLERSIVAKTYRGSDPERLYSIVGYELQGYDGAGREEAIELLRLLKRPAPRPECLTELARLRTLTAQAKKSDTDIQIQIETYADEMQRYPLDVVRDVCRTWPRVPAGKFFPTWSELKPMLDERVLKRTALLNALRRWSAAE